MYSRQKAASLLPSNLLYLTALGLKKPHISVVDFGGATGELGKEFQTLFPCSSFTVVETPTLVAMMHGKSSIQYVASLPASCDIFFSSGTLQYVEMPLDVVFVGRLRRNFGSQFVFQGKNISIANNKVVRKRHGRNTSKLHRPGDIVSASDN